MVAVRDGDRVEVRDAGPGFPDWLVAQGRFTALWGEAAPGAPTVAQWLALPASQRGGAPMIVDSGGMQRSLPPRFLAAIEAWAQGWRALQELSGSVTPFTGRVRAEAEAALAAKHDAEVAALCGSPYQALKHADADVDIIIAQGGEGGGHCGEVGSIVLWPQVVKAVAPRPVLAAGGIGSGLPSRSAAAKRPASRPMAALST